MAVFTNVSDDVLEPGDPIRSVDILAIKENTNFNREFVDIQTFNANGTWTKPLSGGVVVGRLARIQVWGGGGGGARNTASAIASGGGGGGYNEIELPLSDLAATVSVTIGAGGAGATGGVGSGTTGGQTSFGSLISAFGGGAGRALATTTEFAFSGGGGALSAGSNGTTGTNPENSVGNVVGQPFGLSSSVQFKVQALATIWHGGLSANNHLAGEATYGGGAGAATSGTATNRGGGASVHGGKGGNGGRQTTGIDGTQPAGGGGGNNNNLNGGNGAAGRVIVTVW